MRARRFFGYCLASLIALTQVLSGFAAAQQIEDSEDPVIIHRQADTPGVAGELQTFLARVYDDVEVVEVTLYYRQSENAAFESIPMRPLLDSLGEYMIAVETSISEYPGLQYYIEALDASGNVTNRGFSYAPIVLPLKEPETPPAEIISEPLIAEKTGGSGFSASSLLMGVGALLLLGALAGAGGGDDGGTDTGGSDAITLTIVSDAPGGN